MLGKNGPVSHILESTSLAWVPTQGRYVGRPNIKDTVMFFTILCVEVCETERSTLNIRKLKF